MDPELFHPSRGETADVRNAKTVCARCTVRADCLDYALTEEIHFGVWGGTSEKERRALRHNRRRTLGLPPLGPLPRRSA
jgi:WhiB family redox-sensing transcriptional regulator